MSGIGDTVANDFVHAYRSLRSSRAYSIWVVASLATGMAVTIAGLAVLNALLFLPFPEVRDQQQLVRLSLFANCGRQDCWTRLSTFDDYHVARQRLTGTEGLAAYAVADIVVAVPDARSMRGVIVSPDYFEVLGVRPAVGRTFAPADAERHADVAVIAHSMWVRELDADPAVIGRTIRVGEAVVQVIGVAPPQFVGIDRPRPGGARRMAAGRPPDVWLPHWVEGRALPSAVAGQPRRPRELQFVGRLKENVTPVELQAEAAALGRSVAASGGKQPIAERAEVLPVRRVNPGTWPLAIAVVMPVPILVLAIACVNAANLMLARGSQRTRELSIRLAIGASRSRIVRQLLVESTLLALVATMLALPVAWWSLRLAANPWDIQVPLDVTVLALTVLIGASTVIAFGLLPAIRVSAQKPAIALGPASRSDALPGQSRVRRALVAAQVALSLALLATGSQLVATVRSEAVALGNSGDRVLVARFDLAPLRLRPFEVDRFYQDLLDGASRLPGVAAAGLARHTAVWSFGQRSGERALAVWPAGHAPGEGTILEGGLAGGDLFEAVGLRVVQGRTFTAADRHASPQVAIVNEAAAKSLPAPVVGGLVRVAPPGGDYRSSLEVRVVGIVAAAPDSEGPEDPSSARIYLPSSIRPEPALALYVRTAGEPAALVQPLRELVSRVGPQVPIQEVGSLEDLNARAYATQLWLARAAAILGGIGLLLATAGLYGISSYVVTMRSRELAIRMAIGAAPRAILGMVLRQSMRVAGIGLVAGGAAAVAVSRWIQSEYHGVVGIDAPAFGVAIGLFCAAMFLAGLVPAARASRVDPVARLKDA